MQCGGLQEKSKRVYSFPQSLEIIASGAMYADISVRANPTNPTNSARDADQDCHD
jgi:hypothetical protein